LSRGAGRRPQRDDDREQSNQSTHHHSLPSPAQRDPTYPRPAACNPPIYATLTPFGRLPGSVGAQRVHKRTPHDDDEGHHVEFGAMKSPVEIVRFDAEVSLPVTDFASRFSIGPLIGDDSRARVELKARDRAVPSK
jgi:hypothetical protein